MIYVGGEGPSNAKVMFVGEAPGATEDQTGRPFAGTSGDEFTRMIHEAGFIRRDSYVTNVVKVRPPENDLGAFFYRTKTEAKEAFATPAWGCYPKDVVTWGLVDLWDEINTVRPQLIVCMGNTALWAVTGKGDIDKEGTPSGITKWRGSVQLSRHFGEAGQIKTVSTYHPALILRQWEWRNIAMHDLRRAYRESQYPELRLPAWQYLTRPTAETTYATLAMLLERAEAAPLPLVCDIETRGQAYISCIGLAWSRTEAICIPLVAEQLGKGYYALDDEVEILHRLQVLLVHRNVQLIGQNFSYDAQYFAYELGFVPPVAHDTMAGQHVLWSGLPKALHFQASMYNEHYCYWKDDGKDWDPKIHSMEQHWVYNCRDCTETYEVWENQCELLTKFNLWEQFNFLHGKMFKPVLKLMLRGVLQDRKARAQMLQDCLNGMADREQYLAEELGHPLNPRSTPQMRALFYEDFGQKPVWHKKEKRVTLDDDAMKVIAAREPLLRDICDAIGEYRSIGSIVGALKAKVDPDNRLRCSYGTSSVETYRLNSGKNAFGGGFNMQNVSTGERKRGKAADLPNMKYAFIPDPGHEWAEIDLEGADMQVMAWEGDIPLMKEIFRSRQKIHAIHAKEIYGGDAGPDGRKEPYYSYAKFGCHAYDYYGKPPTVAKILGIPVHSADRFMRRYFQIHPRIPVWHREVEAQLMRGVLDRQGNPIPGTERTVFNRFGFKRRYFDRIDSILPEALAWVPQSTVGIVINKVWLNIEEQLPWITVLMQVHDSLNLQYLISNRNRLPELLPHTRITVPYDDPLIIPVELKRSTRSWGHCEKDEVWDKG